MVQIISFSEVIESDIFHSDANFSLYLRLEIEHPKENRVTLGLCQH